MSDYQTWTDRMKLRLEAAERLIDMLTYDGSDRGYTRNSQIWANELWEAANSWAFVSGEDVDLSWIKLDG